MYMELIIYGPRWKGQRPDGQNALYKLIHGPKSNGRKSFGRKSLGQNLHWTK